MNYFFLDASAWVKRFHQEPGSDIVNSLVDRLLPTSPQRLAISPLGLAEVIAALNRQKNEGRLPWIGRKTRTRGAQSVHF